MLAAIALRRCHGFPGSRCTVPVPAADVTPVALRIVPAAAARDEDRAPRRPLLDLLREAGDITGTDLARATVLAARQETRLRDILLSHAMVTEERLLMALSRQWGAPIVDPALERPDLRLVDRLGAAEALRLRMLPWRRTGGVTVILAPWPEDVLRERERLTALFGPVVPALVTEAALVSTLLAARRLRLRDRAERSVPAAESCRDWQGGALAILAAALAGAAAIALLFAPVALFFLPAALAVGTLLAQTGLKTAAIVARLPSLRAERRAAEPSPLAIARRPVVSILVPMFREPDIAPRLVARLSRIDYPRELLDILLVVEECDEETRAALEAANLPPWMRVVTVPDGPVRTKPRAMNFALDFARGTIIGVYDAEDAPAPGQIQDVVRRFHETAPEVVCLQGVLDFYNARTNWLARCFTIEYAAWFRVILPGIQRLGLPLPLGGTTLFFRRAALEELGRWDAHNVTEDADLGMRLARHGYRTEMVATVTEEEANCRLVPWIKQRSRWQKGYAITWAVAMRDPGAFRRRIGWGPFLGVQLMFLSMLSQPLLAPVLWSFWALAAGLGHPVAGTAIEGFIPLLVGLFLLAEAVNLLAGALAVSVPRRRFLLAWLPTMHFYYPLAAFAAYKALYELAARPFYWDKTQHGLFDGLAGLEEPEPEPLPAAAVA